MFLDSWKYFCWVHMTLESSFPSVQALCQYLLLTSLGCVFTSRSWALSPLGKIHQLLPFDSAVLYTLLCYFLMISPKAIRKISLRIAWLQQNPRKWKEAQQPSLRNGLQGGNFYFCMCVTNFLSINTVPLWRSCRDIHSIN